MKTKLILSIEIKEKKDQIVLTNKLITDDNKKAERFFNDSLKQGDEGVMIKNLNSHYIPGRYVDGWAKLKNILDNKSFDLLLFYALNEMFQKALNLLS